VTVTIPITSTLVTATLPSEGLPTPTLPEVVIPTESVESAATAVPTNTPTPQVTTALSTTITPGVGTPPASGTVTATPTFGPGTPTLTPDPNATATPTTDPNATATQTATPGAGGNIVVKEALETESLNKDTLAANEIHAWPITLFGTNEVVTVTAVTADDANLVLAIVDEDGDSLIEVNDSGVSGVETIGQFPLSVPGPYAVHVKTVNGNPAEYALMLLFEDSLNFIFKPIITYGFEERTVLLSADSEHFWNFAGNGGDTILIVADPDDSTDVFLEIYGPDANLISPAFISVGGNGVTEQLQWNLPEDGLYSIRVGEWNFAAGSYLFSLDEN
jgi:hypothetical protein